MHLPRLVPRAATEDSLDFFTAASPRADGGPSTRSFVDLGVSEDIQQALGRAQFPRPSRVQELVIPAVARGATAVVAAETGSGKTLAYLAPLASMLLRHRQRLTQQTQEAQQQGAPGGGGTSINEAASAARRSHALVLCPNFALCQQVLAVAQSMRSESGAQLVSAACINASSPPPPDAPDIIISTPAALINFLNEAGPTYGWLWSPEGFQAKVRHVVLDEADLLLTKAFSKPVTQLLQLMRTGDRRRVEAKVFSELGIDKGDFDRLPRPMQQAMWQKGTPGLQEAGYRLPGGWERMEGSTYGPYWRRQYLFVAATMPSITLSDVGADIQRMFPTIEWLSSELLHQSKPKIEHTWVAVEDTTVRAALVNALCSDAGFSAGTAKVLVFAGTTTSADEVSALLSSEGLEHSVYHKGIAGADREAALQAMAAPCTGSARVMVCTDAAARGLDVPDVTHVVQADFAPNAIDFIHRIGRTGRAGRPGKVTSLYRAGSRAENELVTVLRLYVAEGRPLEAAFSRARSFSRKLKRSGEFVPRGYTKGQMRGEGGSPDEGEESLEEGRSSEGVEPKP
ncbi:hypothetical protein FOA52_003452 [Chlamydomonas sp. UWO 241]|nr:hypothetical protein FOA52_003452 [Chlamydomonas sp. UWO 241]